MSSTERIHTAKLTAGDQEHFVKVGFVRVMRGDDISHLDLMRVNDVGEDWIDCQPVRGDNDLSDLIPVVQAKENT